MTALEAEKLKEGTRVRWFSGVSGTVVHIYSDGLGCDIEWDDGIRSFLGFRGMSVVNIDLSEE